MNKLGFTSDSLVIYEQTRILRLQYKDILCFTIDRPYLVITTNAKQHICVYVSLSKMVQMLPDYFCLCSQSTAVNLLYVCSYGEQNGHIVVNLSNSDSYIVSRRCKKNIRNKLLNINK